MADANARSAAIEAIVREVNPIGLAEDLGLPIAEPARFLLVERNQGSAGNTQSHWFTTHESAEKAGEYNVRQAYAEEWWIELLVDLDTGERFEAVYGVTFEKVQS